MTGQDLYFSESTSPRDPEEHDRRQRLMVLMASGSLSGSLRRSGIRSIPRSDR
ncbi:MAG: hypothetical protein MZV63_34940 [Marinilabiliales bacterium]|nr:hypothetical protein [Marinilabiliales bacterium]